MVMPAGEAVSNVGRIVGRRILGEVTTMGGRYLADLLLLTEARADPEAESMTQFVRVYQRRVLLTRVWQR
jgi:hypothetical protein